jgi:hypothetical protein
VISSCTVRLKTVFANTPDVPVKKFTLIMKGGDRGLLVNSGTSAPGDDRLPQAEAQNSRQLKTKNLRFTIPRW